MSGPTDRDPILDRAGELARGLEPAPLGADETKRWLDRAVAQAAAPRPAPAPRRWVAPLAVAASLAVAVLAGALVLRPDADPRPSAPLRLDLPTHDRIVATPGARFEVQSIAPERRAIALREGAMLFDVAPLSGGSTFEVTTGTARVRVTGTVFSVRARPEGTMVTVYEGSVEITDARGTRTLEPDRTWSSSEAARQAIGVDPLEPEGMLAAARRTAAAKRPVPVAVATPSPAAARGAGAPHPHPLPRGERGPETTASPAAASGAGAPHPHPLPRGERGPETTASPAAASGAGAPHPHPLPRGERGPETTASPAAASGAGAPHPHPLPRGERGPETTASPAAASGAGAPHPHPLPRGERGPEATSSPAVATASPAVTPAPAGPRLAEVRAWIAAGRGGEAIDAADRALSTAPGSVAWKMLRADALRSTGRNAEAADQYDAVAGAGGEASTAGYQAARLRLRALHEPAAALRSLDASRADDPGSPIAERALALRIDALTSLGRQAEADGAVARYLAEFPGGGRAEELRARGQAHPGHDLTSP